MRGAEHARQACLERSLREREHTADRSQPTVERELSDGRMLGQGVLRDLTGRGQDRERDREVERRPLFSQRRGSEVDRDPSQRPLQLRRGDPASDAVLGLLARAVGEADDRESRHAVFQMRLDLDTAGLEADERVREGAREHPLHGRVPGLACL